MLMPASRPPTASQRILVINPNSNREVTEHMSRALDGLRFAGGPAIDCLTLADGPPGVESERDVARAAAAIVAAVERERPRSAAFVVACFSDPGLHAAREAAAERPVFGIAQCGLAAALALGERFGIVSILSASLARHRRYVASLGLLSRLAGDVAIDMGVAALAREDEVLRRMGEAGRRLKEQGADVVVMGCAGMARYRPALEQALAVPVIDPTQAAAAMALLALRTGRP